MINFNDTVIENINDKLARAQHGDIQIVYNKEDSFICCSDILKQLNNKKDVYDFIRQKCVSDLLMGGNK